MKPLLNFFVLTFVLIIAIISVISLAYVSAQVNVGQIETDIEGVNIIVPDTPLFNNNTASVNFSAFADIWITNEGDKDNVADIVIDELGDVDTTGVSTGDFLQKSSGDWVDFDLFGTANDFTATQTFSATTASAGIAQRIVHDGDTNTYIEYTIDQIDLVAGNLLFMRFDEQVATDFGTWFFDGSDAAISVSNKLTGKDIVINEGGTNADFRIESDNDFFNFFSDGVNDRIGIGTELPRTKLDVVGNATVRGELNVTNNATFEQDVIIVGTLFGGSPVKIAGVNITNNLFDLIENRNSSSRFILQNTNESTNATAVISAVNDVGGSMFIGIGSSSFVLGGISRPNITALASKSRGEMVLANFFKEAFIWLYNPSDDNDPKNLVEIMRLDDLGLNVTGNITSENTFASQYIFSHTNETIRVLAANEWTNITFGEDEAHIRLGIDHHHDDFTNDTFEIHADGIYDISYGLTLIDKSPGATDIDMAARVIYTNSTELSGSVFQTDIIKQEIETSISHRFLARLVVGNEIKFQFIASDADVEVSDHSIFGDDPESALIVITKIGNLV